MSEGERRGYYGGFEGFPDDMKVLSPTEKWGTKTEYGHVYRTAWGDEEPCDKAIVIFCHMIATLSVVAHLTGISAPLS